MDELTASMISNIQIFYRDGREIARWVYNDNGTIKKEGKKVTGIVRMYHPEGMLSSEMTYRNGELNGRYLLLSEQGRIEEEGAFKNNELDGSWKQYYDTGSVKLEGVYRIGKRNGSFRLYFPNGMLQEEETYANGRLYGGIYFNNVCKGFF